MAEEEYFRKHYPDVCYNGKPLSPYWDLFQDGVEFGERQSEKKIEELERKLEQTEKDLTDYQFNYPTIKELEKENAELKARLNAINLLTPELEKLSKAKTQQLTKAKEIIRQFLNDYPVITKELLDKLEQFIKEIEK